MCGSVKYQPPEHPPITIGYGNPKAAMPIEDAGAPEGVIWIPWGRRERQHEAKGLPVTGWARVDTLNQGGWDKYRPRFVLLAVQQFSEKGNKGPKDRVWFDIDEPYAIQAVIAKGEGEARLFVVTVPIPEALSWIHDRWPKVVRKDNPEAEGRLNRGYRFTNPQDFQCMALSVPNQAPLEFSFGLDPQEYMKENGELDEERMLREGVILPQDIKH